MKQIILSSLYLLILFCLNHFVFGPSYLFYEFLWLDIPMHILGGFGVAMFFAAIFSYKNIKVSYTKIFILYLIIAIAWEFYEYVNDIISFSMWNGNWTDTFSDFINGFIGMSIAYFFIKK